MLPRAQDGLFGSREVAERLPGAQEDRFCSREVAERFPGAQDGRFCSREALHVGLHNRDHHIVGAFLHRQRIQRVLQPALPKGGTQAASAVERHAGVNAVVS